MARALYRKYRSKSLSEIVGQEHITRTLSEALARGNISHAYLFTGPRGVGKTSIARILAHEINKIPYEDDAGHIDIIEIDAASNRRIDEIRELRDKVHIAPALAPYKVYIIDEVHMLTREAFNALLKTLEEPPAHAVFILATTDAHKLPETIISRTQRFTFRPVDKPKVVEHLRSIADQEKIKISDEALEILAEQGEGSFRDSISMLDQAGSISGEITTDDIYELLGMPPKTLIEELYSRIQSGASNVIAQNISDLYNQGYQPASVAKELGAHIRSLILNDKLQLTENLASLLTELLEVPVSNNPDRYLEIVLLRYAGSIEKQPGSRARNPDSPEQPKKVIETKVTSTQAVAEAPRPKLPKEEPKAKQKAPEDESAAATAGKQPAAFNLEVWPQLLNALKQRYNTLYGVIRMAEPVFADGDKLQLKFGFAFHQKRISEPGNRKIVVGILKELTGRNIAVECIYQKGAIAPKVAVAITPSTAAAKGDDSLKAISNIFGGGELLQS